MVPAFLDTYLNGLVPGPSLNEVVAPDHPQLAT